MLTDADGDYSAIAVDSAGRVKVVGAFGGGGGLTDAELRATPVPVSGTVSVSEPVTVDGTVGLDAASLAALETVQVANFPAVQPVSGTVSVVEPVTVDGTVALDAGSLAALETIQVANFPATQPVSAVDLDVRDLTSATDSVTADVAPMDAWTPGTVDVGAAAAVQLDVAPIAGRLAVSVKALTANTDTVRIAPSAADAAADATSFLLDAGEPVDLDLSGAAEVWARSVSGTQRVTFIQGGA